MISFLILLICNGYFVQSKQTSPPLPDVAVEECLKLVMDKLEKCRDESLSRWNIKDDEANASTKNMCCAEWQSFDCILAAVETKCSKEQIKKVKTFSADFIDHLEETRCSEFPKDSKLCV